MFNPPQKIIGVSVAGSTERTVQVAQVLLESPDFQVPWVLTGGPKLVGRKQVLTPNPVSVWATRRQIPIIQIEKKITDQIKTEVQAQPAVDVLLVVDFGYLIPAWLLELPKLAPLNIHPSKLPRWRGSSPGQFVLLYGEKNSAVTLMIMDSALDHGPILTQLPLAVENSWTQTDYYQKNFDLIAAQLPSLISQFALGQLKTTTQPDQSPTPVARRLIRDDGFIEWQSLQIAMQSSATPDQTKLNPLLTAAASAHPSLATLISCACRALSPWPGVWTVVPTAQGERRMKILACRCSEKNQLILETVQLEGKQLMSWNKIKQAIH